MSRSVIALDYLKSAKGMVGATDMLRMAVIRGDSGDIDFASDMLARAADDYLGKVANYEKFGFDQIARATMEELPKRERVASDILASALTDIVVANTLLLAGGATGETPKPISENELGSATRQLDNLTNTVVLPLGRSIDEPAKAARFGFDEVPVPVVVTASPDLDTTKAKYKNHVTELLDSLITETKKVIKAGFESVDELDENQLSQAIKNMGNTALQLPKAGKLISRGLEIAIVGLNKLTKLLGEENIDALKEKAQELVDEFKKGAEPLDKFLTYSYGISRTNTHIADLLNNTSADTAKIDQGAQQLVDLQTRFSESMVLLNRIVRGLNIGKKFVSSFLPQATVVLLFGSFYLVAMDYAVLSGMDYADTTNLIKFIEGVIKISEETLS